MKKLLFLFLAILTCYLAGVYRYPALMLLFVTEAVFLVVSCFLPYYFRKNLKVAFLRHSEVMEKNIPIDCVIAAENMGRLPISRLGIKLRLGYGNNKEIVKRVYGGVESGKAELHFQVTAQYCGIIQLTMESFSVYDYLALFSKKKKWNESIKIAVFPPERALQIELPSFLRQESPQQQEQQLGWGGEAHDEIRQLREYRIGDSNRHIHWNQSAKMDSIWIKEFEKETDRRPELWLDMKGIENATRRELDAFYELLSAIVHGLFQWEGMIRVSWYGTEKKAVEYTDIMDTAQCRDMLLRIYRSEPFLRQQAQETAARDSMTVAGAPSISQLAQNADRKNLASTPEGYFKLDLALNWYQNETLIFRFSGEPEALSGQIEQKVFIV